MLTNFLLPNLDQVFSIAKDMVLKINFLEVLISSLGCACQAILEHLQKTDAVLTRLMEQLRQQARLHITTAPVTWA